MVEETRCGVCGLSPEEHSHEFSPARTEMIVRPVHERRCEDTDSGGARCDLYLNHTSGHWIRSRGEEPHPEMAR